MKGSEKENILKCMIVALLLFAGMENNKVYAKSAINSSGIKYEFGVFNSVEEKDIAKLNEYRTIVLDAQNISKKSIKKLRKTGHTVYSYINLGSVENYRDYYKDYEDITLDEYENWEDERWVDVSKKKWQDFLSKTLARKLVNKGIDGFFVDNVDVYYQYHNDDIFNGVTTILKNFKALGVDVVVNGGDTYVRKYVKRHGKLNKVLDAVAQESVFTSIDWDNDNAFIEQDKGGHKYAKSYINFVSKHGGNVYLIEYSTDKKIIDKISKYCKKKGYVYYAANNLDLGANNTDEEKKLSSQEIVNTKTTKINKIKKSKNKVVFKLKKIKGIKYYEICVAKNNVLIKDAKRIKSKSNKLVIKGLGYKGFFRVRTVIGKSGKYYYSKWSKIRKF